MMTSQMQTNPSRKYRCLFTLGSGIFGGFVHGLADECDVPHGVALEAILTYAPAAVGAAGYGLQACLQSLDEKLRVESGKASDELVKKVDEFNGNYVRTMTATGVVIGSVFGGGVTAMMYVIGRGVGAMIK